MAADDGVAVRAEHAALMYAVGALRRDSWVQSEAYLQCRGRRVDSLAMMLRSVQLVAEWLVDDERNALLGRLQGELERLVSRHGDKLDSEDHGGGDGQASHLDEPLRRLLGGDDA